MGTLFLCKQKLLSRKDMDMFNNPSKRIRLDIPNNGNFPNDDLWGAEDDLTAEEFDKLEFQATQSHKSEDVQTTFLQPLPPVSSTSFIQEEDYKQQLYELEGRVKILTQSLEKASNQLKEEKLKRDKVVNDKIVQSTAKENELRKEIKRVESSLQFKNQEMKSLYEKVHLLETQLKEKKEQTNLPNAQASNSFLERFQFDAGSSNQKPGICQTNKPRDQPKPFRKNTLPVDIPRGRIQGTDIISTLLCNRLTENPRPQTSTTSQTSFISEPTTELSPRLSAIALLRLGSDHEPLGMLHYFNSVFKNYLRSLESIKATGSNLNSPSSRRKDVKKDKALVISCLKDLINITSTEQFVSLLQKCFSVEMNENQMKHEEPVYQMKSLLQSLILLASPVSYPVSYSKSEEIDMSLASLVSWSTSTPEGYVHLSENISYKSIICCYEETTSLLLWLKLITNICTHKKFTSKLLHTDDSCLLCTLSSLAMQKISQDPSKYTSVMHSIEDLLTALFSVHSFQELELERSPCVTLVVQAVVVSLWKLCQLFVIEVETCHLLFKLNTEKRDTFLVLKKGCALIELFSRYLLNFKEMRSACEDSYVSFMGGMLILSKSKEIPFFKDLYDIVHDLWDFQDDMSEFDLDDAPSEDSPQTAENPSQSTS